jgi:glycosyltransferase involved in cell wall biosynthesis
MATTSTRIAYILTPITFGGAEKVSLNFLRTVDRNRFDVQPILLTRPWEEEPYFACELQQLGYAYDTIPVGLKASGDRLRVPRVAWRLHSILKHGAFNLVHTHGYFADICGLPVARLLAINSISTCHGFIANDRKLSIYNLLDKYALRLSRAVIAVSEGIKDELTRSGIQNLRIEVIPNAVEPPAGEEELRARRQEKRRSLAIAPHEHLVGFLGRLSEEKGLTYLIEAAAELRDAAVPVKLLLIGDGPERSPLEQLVRARGLESMVIFAGFQTDIENWLPAFDSFVLPSLTEGTPMALLEAMAVGVPVIATAVGGVPKVVTDGVNGFLVPPGEVGPLSEKIQMLIENPDLKRRLSIEGINTIKRNYDIFSWCRRIENLYDGIK